MKPLLFAAFAASTLALASTARAQADVATTPDAPFVFKGRAVYVGGGGGVLTDIQEPTQNWSILATFPLASWLALEIQSFGYHFQARTADPREKADSVALGIGAGLRAAPPVTHRFRPFAAARLQHIHMLWDPWVPPDPSERSGDSGPSSDHRWAVAGAAGIEVGLGRRLRGSLEAGPFVFTGPATNVGFQTVLSIGYGF